MNMLNPRLAELFGFMIAIIASGVIYAHGGSRWGHSLDWHTDQIDEVISSNASGQKISVEGRECVSGTNLSFKVNDSYASDIDEAVWVDLAFYLGDSDAKLAFYYDSNVPWKDTAHSLQLPSNTQGKWHKQSLLLERARFANLLSDGADFAIAVDDPALDTSKSVRPFTVCSLTLRRSYKTPHVKDFGQLSLEILDENGQPTPARLGLYETSGRIPLPSEDAILLKDNEVGKTRITFVGSPWPVQNRSVFYADGHYHATLPAKTYDLIVAKGSEYRFVRRHFALSANESKVIKIQLQRWTDMAARGWYSGEDHIHYERSGPEDDRILATFTRGEDLKVANILEFDDALKKYFPHYDWKTVRPDPEAPFVLAPGQEAPRTSLLGHTTELNIHQPIRDADHYLLYHGVFEQTHAQGGLAGFAHLVARPDLDACYAPKGMPIDVPFGLVDFAEIFTNVSGDPSLWFDYLNLGYKIAPTAGTDWPWGSVPGTARNYVKIDGPFTPQAWFDGLKAGRTFTSSGPMLEFSINGEDIGSELHLSKGESLDIRAKVSLNPDLGTLLKLELIEQGETVKAVLSKEATASLAFHYTVPAKHGTWYVLRAWGKDHTVLAVSAPIYVRVDGQSFWKPSAVPAIVSKLKAQMNAVLNPDPSEGGCSEGWYTQATITEDWNNQKDALKQRIDQASAIYDDLVKRAAASAGTYSRNDVINIVFIGDSITEGDYLPQAPPIISVDWLREHVPSVSLFFSNQGKSGHTTVDALPATHSDFPEIEKAATQLESTHEGRLIFSVMLGTNDSAMDGPLGSPVSPEDYRGNLATIIDRLLEDYPDCTIILHRPLWYSSNTYNGARYLADGRKRLQSYFPEIDALVARYGRTHPQRVLRGDTKGFEFFRKKYQTFLMPEDGQRGTFYLHPNQEGAEMLGRFWAEAIQHALQNSVIASQPR